MRWLGLCWVTWPCWDILSPVDICYACMEGEHPASSEYIIQRSIKKQRCNDWVKNSKVFKVVFVLSLVGHPFWFRDGSQILRTISEVNDKGVLFVKCAM